ncbi:MAG: hypothetical protein ACO34J_10985 [Prochlorothrix sp.]
MAVVMAVRVASVVMAVVMAVRVPSDRPLGTIRILSLSDGNA